jgi:hypothetical protein
MTLDILRWSPDDYQALVAMARTQGAPPEWFAAVMYRESDLNPKAMNPSIPTLGINQISAPNLKAYGLSDEQLALFLSWSPARQMKYVERFYRPWRPATGWVSRAQIYQAAYMPGTIKWKGSDPATVLSKKGQPEYDLNTSLDPDKKGFVTVGDLERVLQARIDRSDSLFDYALAGIDNAGGNLEPGEVAMLERAGFRTVESPWTSVSPPASNAGLAAVFVGAALLGVGGYYALRTAKHGQPVSS